MQTCSESNVSDPHEYSGPSSRSPLASGPQPDCSNEEQQRPGDLGLFDHDDRSAIETDGTRSDVDFSDNNGEDDQMSGSEDQGGSEEYVPSSNGTKSRDTNSVDSTRSEDSIDFLSPSKGALCRSTLNRDIDHDGSFHSKT